MNQPDSKSELTPESVSGFTPNTATHPHTPEHPILEFNDADLARLLRRAAWLTAVLGLVLAVLLGFALGWQSGALLAVGAAISVASVFEWARLIRLFNARMDAQRMPRGATLSVALFLLRLLFFAAAIYGSLKFLHGSVFSLIGGLALAVVALVWQALKVLRGSDAA